MKKPAKAKIVKVKVWPIYVAIGSPKGTVLRHDGGLFYWRDAGNWGFHAIENSDGFLVVKIKKGWKKLLGHIDGAPLYEVSKARYQKDNGQWSKV